MCSHVCVKSHNTMAWEQALAIGHHEEGGNVDGKVVYVAAALMEVNCMKCRIIL